VSNQIELSRGDVLAKKYEVVDLLDESPLGVTYRVKHLDSGKYVRLLLMRPKTAGKEQRDQLVAAFKAAKAITHPHLVKFGELGEHNGVAYVTFEDFEGGTLRELLQEYKINSKQFAVKEAAQICMQILEGLEELHKSGIVLRALRPEYVLVNVRWTGPRRQTFVAQTKLVGAGFWSLIPSAVLAEDEFTRGEAQYIAPELKSFEPVPSPRSDVYSAGVIFYEMLVGTAPVGTFQLPKVRRPDLPDHVNDVVELALAHAPEDRYPSGQDFANDIQRTFQDASLVQDPPMRPIVTPLAWVMALALVVFIGVILFNLRPNPALQAEAADSQIRAEVFDEYQASAPSPEEFRQVYARHPKNMIYVPTGPYVAGRLHTENDGAFRSEPLAERRSTAGFLIDMFEHPNLKGGQPAHAVSFSDAERLCKESSKRLCSAEEWERACKGPQSTVYSYGDTYDQDFCGKGVEDPHAAGAKPDCKSQWGVFDMSGSFREWTSTASKTGRYLVKGGLKSQPEKGTRCAKSTDESVGFVDSSISFRCCRDLDAPPIQ